MGWAIERNWTEVAVDSAAAVIFAAAVAYSYSTLLPAGSAIVAIAVAGFLLVTMALGQVPVGEGNYALPAFELVPVEPTQEAQGDATAELLLHDELTAVDPDARVVRLFGPSRGPGAGALDSRGSKTDLPDASEALIEALSELRRSFH